MDQRFARIVIGPPSGVAVIRGTRVPVSVILDSLAEELSPEDISREYPNIAHEDILEACACGAALAREHVWALAPSP